VTELAKIADAPGSTRTDTNRDLAATRSACHSADRRPLHRVMKAVRGNVEG
jgi:hypothetical protein